MGAIVPLRTSGSGSTAAFAAAIAFVAILAAAGSARATDDPAAAEAKKHYEEGTKAFNLGEYPRAIAEFKATYNAKPDPLLLYNIAQSYRLAEDASQALFFYKSFLRNMPAATNRKEVEGRIKELEKKVAEQKRDPSTAPPPVAVPALSPGPTPPPVTSGTTAAPAPTPPPVASPPISAEPPKSTSTPPKKPRSAPPQPAAPPAETSPAPQVDLTTPSPPPSEEPSSPIYKKWWFWAGAAGAVILISGLAAASARKPPDTPLGTWDPTWMP